MRLVNDLDRGANAWAVGRFDLLATQAKLPAGLSSQIPAIKWFAAAGRVNGGVSAALRAETRDEEAARNLRDVVNGFMALARMQSEARPEWNALMSSLQLSGTGTDMSATRQAFHALTTGLLNNLGNETLKKTVLEMKSKAQVAVDIMIRNLFERTADIGFLATDDDIRDYAAKLGVSEEKAREAGMDAMSETFRSSGAEIYQPK